MVTDADQLLAGRYQRGRLLGSGGMGAVYLAEDSRLRRPVAVKICSTRTLPPPEADAASELFQAEALTLARLHHPGLTQVWDYFAHADDWHLVMEYVPGTTLRELLQTTGGKLGHTQILDYAGQLCDVLNYLHGQQPPIVFRDLKPANIMVTPEGTLKLIDFGIARLFQPGKHADTAQFGTPGYAPLEQYGGQTEPRSDIYSLGVLVHQMLTGHNPLGSAFAIPPARVVDPTLGAEVEEVLLKATAAHPDQRFPTAADFCVALRRALQPTSSPAARATVSVGATQLVGDPTPRSMWTPSSRTLPARPQGGRGRGVLVALLLCVLLGSLGTAGYVLQPQVTELLALLRPPVAYSSPGGVALPGTVIYAAPGTGGNDDFWLRESDKAPQLLVDAPPGTTAALLALSPDKRQIAYTFIVKATSQEQLWVRPLQGGEPRRILPDYDVVRAPSWSPDGERLAVEVGNDSVDHDVVTVNLQAGATDVAVVVDSNRWEGGPSWSGDGRIAYHALKGPCMLLYVADPATDTTQQLTELPTAADCAKDNGDFWPTWSPDDTRIAFGRQLGTRKQIGVYTFATNSIQFWDTGSLARRPRWSPADNALLFDEGDTDQTVLSYLDLETKAVVTLSGTERARLADWR